MFFWRVAGHADFGGPSNVERWSLRRMVQAHRYLDMMEDLTEIAREEAKRR